MRFLHSDEKLLLSFDRFYMLACEIKYSRRCKQLMLHICFLQPFQLVFILFSRWLFMSISIHIGINHLDVSILFFRANCIFWVVSKVFQFLRTSMKLFWSLQAEQFYVCYIYALYYFIGLKHCLSVIVLWRVSAHTLERHQLLNALRSTSLTLLSHQELQMLHYSWVLW